VEALEEEVKELRRELAVLADAVLSQEGKWERQDKFNQGVRDALWGVTSLVPYLKLHRRPRS